MSAVRFQSPWYLNKLVGLEIGPTGAQFGIDPQDAEFAKHFSGQTIVEQCIAVNAEYLVIWAKDNELAYYNSEIVPKAPALGKRDVLLESVKAAKKYNLPVIAYCELQYPAYLLREQPQFLMRDVNGQEIPGRVCFNSGYIKHAKHVATEISKYDIDGFHFDMMDQGFESPYGCWCSKCQALFEATYGHFMPTQMGWDAEWEKMLEFRYNTSATFEKQLTKHVKSKHPNISVDFNYHGAPPCAWEVGQRPVQHAHIGDFVTGECGTWAFGPLQTSLSAQFLAATKPGATYQVVMQPGSRMYHDTTTRPIDDMRWEALTLLAHGAQVTVVDKTSYDGKLNSVTYQRIREIFVEAQNKRPHFGHQPWKEVGVYYSCPSRDWYGKEKPDNYQRSFIGAHRALTYSHIPMGVILNENITLDNLKQFPIVYLPNIAILNTTEIELLSHYVENGGNLLATGLTGLYGQLGHQLPQSAINQLIGGQFVKMLSDWDNHVALPEQTAYLGQLSRDIPPNWPFLLYGPAAIFEATTALGYGQLYQPHRTLQQRKSKGNLSLPMSADVAVGPAMLINNYGKGKVIYLPCSPDAAVASEYRTIEPRLLIRNLIRFLNPSPEVEVEAPSHVESVITIDEVNKLWRIHLIGYLSPPACTGPGRPHSNFVLPPLIEDKPLYRAKIKLDQPFNDIWVLNTDTAINQTSDGIEFLINEIHETVIIEQTK